MSSVFMGWRSASATQPDDIVMCQSFPSSFSATRCARAARSRLSTCAVVSSSPVHDDATILRRHTITVDMPPRFTHKA